MPVEPDVNVGPKRRLILFAQFEASSGCILTKFGMGNRAVVSKHCLAPPMAEKNHEMVLQECLLEDW